MEFQKFICGYVLHEGNISNIDCNPTQRLICQATFQETNKLNLWQFSSFKKVLFLEIDPWPGFRLFAGSLWDEGSRDTCQPAVLPELGTGKKHRVLRATPFGSFFEEQPEIQAIHLLCPQNEVSKEYLSS